MIKILTGSQGTAKGQILGYCFEHFESEEIWLLDSLQVFDPYALSRLSPARARKMLALIKISRPFTFYQLKEKIFSLTKMSLNGCTLIISGIDCFEDQLDEKEKSAHLAAMANVISTLSVKNKVFVWTKSTEFARIFHAMLRKKWVAQ